MDPSMFLLQLEPISQRVNPEKQVLFFTFTETYFGYAGCDTYLTLHCNEFGSDVPPSIFTSSFSCRPIGLSCLHKIEEIIQESGLRSMEFYALPMKLPNRCVTQQACVVPPNPFSFAGYAGVTHF
ncbi:uncharacterized protein LOC124369264 [Homalodisca vitripennis]|uniref:uncharacterized protein LOC124369264 n=1 Tax=Homalodisca vitripennis TaxID=197043 RepID=UPI001EEBD467|nr:uncharacterized protein LOC124369264 [Homalodisca vitripennis]